LQTVYRLPENEIKFIQSLENLGYIKIDPNDKQTLYVKTELWDDWKSSEDKGAMIAKFSTYFNGHKYNNWKGYGKNWIIKIRLMESKKLVGEQSKDLTIRGYKY
jgi:hypothetical protein